MIKDLAKHVRAKTQKINKRSLNLNGGRERSGPAQHAARAVLHGACTWPTRGAHRPLDRDRTELVRRVPRDSATLRGL
jgi:hypothetical protein